MPALLFLSLALGVLSGCRDSQATGVPVREVPHLRFAAGDTFVFSRWVLDTQGYLVPSTQATDRWRVLAAGGSMRGRDNVAIVLDSLGSAGAPDTLLIQVAPTGEIFAYGYLARLVRQQQGITIPRNWDRIAAFGTGSWVVGTADAAGQAVITGSLAEEPDYYTVGVNGVPTVVRAYRVELVGPLFDHSFAVSDAPSCFTRFVQEPSDTLSGQVSVLAEVYPAGR